MNAAHLLGVLAVVLCAAKACGWLAQRIGQPAVLGELIAGVILGGSVLKVVDFHDPVIHFLAELGVVILLFEIGLETDLRKLLAAGPASTVVALVGVALPFALGYGVCRWWGLDNLVSIVAGAALTATSVGITARVLSDLGRLQEPESQIVLGAAVIDDVIGLIILTVVARMTAGTEVTPLSIGRTTAVAFGFLLGTLLVGTLVVPRLASALRRIDAPGIVITSALILALGLAWLADACGSAMIIGAFAAGVLLTKTPQAREIEHGVASIGQFFVPVFFVVVGAAVDIRAFNPLEPDNWKILAVGASLIAGAIVSKFVAGYAPFWFKGRKAVIGVGMIPRGEVGLIFAQMGLSSGLFDAALFSAVTLMVMVTTFVAPPLLKLLFPPVQRKQKPPEPEGIEQLVTEA
jgi:Kef-type K+ transport system membrane component KefB